MSFIGVFTFKQKNHDADEIAFQNPVKDQEIENLGNMHDEERQEELPAKKLLKKQTNAQDKLEATGERAAPKEKVTLSGMLNSLMSKGKAPMVEVVQDTDKQMSKVQEEGISAYDPTKNYKVEREKAINDISACILNSRKIAFTPSEIGGDNKISIVGNSVKTDMKFEIQNRDSNNRSILHRAAFDHNHSQVNDTLNYLKEGGAELRKFYIERLDKYGNTPLLLACIKKPTEISKQQNQQFVIQMLLDEGADPNVKNPFTHFTPLHWACIHGDQMIVTKLLKTTQGAKHYIPDKKGFFPIDYAGIFERETVVNIIIQHHLDEIQSLKHLIKEQRIKQDAEPDAFQKSKILKEFWDNILKELPNQNFSPILQFAPILNTSMLYWAAKFKDVSIDMMKKMLIELECYPEGPVAMENWRTPIHAAAQVGNDMKLKELLSEVNTRYLKENISKSPGAKEVQYSNPLDRYKKGKNICFDFENKWSAFLGRRTHLKLKKFNNFVFQAKLLQYRRGAEEVWRPSLKEDAVKFSFDFLDQNLNSPLHVASQFGHHFCIEVLLIDYCLSIDRRNIDGWMAKDIVQHDKVKNAYNKHYKRNDKKIMAKLKKEQELNEGIAPSLSQKVSLPKSALSSRNGKVQPSLNTTAAEEEIQENNVELMKSKLSGQNERDRLNEQLILSRDYMPYIPPLVLKVSIPKQNDQNSQIINNMIQSLTQSKFTIQMFPSLDTNVYYIGMKLDQVELENEAKNMELKIKLCNVDAKRVFDRENKGLFEPFRTKDIQIIMTHKLYNLANIAEYKKQKIILSVIQMHDMFGIHEINNRWWSMSYNQPIQQKRKCCGGARWYLMPLPLINQFFRESYKFQFSELSSIKNYFGEKVGFYYAWMSYYTVWLLIPAIAGLAITIYQVVTKDFDTIFATIYALLVCIWVTIFIERWKRKSAEICLKWGISDMANSSENRVLRDEFLGYEYFSHETRKTEKKTYKAHRIVWVFILSIPVILLLLGLCIATFFGNINLKQYKSGNSTIDTAIKTFAGVLNGIVIGVIDYAYSQFATLCVGFENHKYRDSYEKSYVFKIFIFKFVNTNLSLLYTAFNDRDFDSLYYLILGMSITKAVQINLMKNFKKYAFFWAKKKLYFRRIRQEALNQQIQHRIYVEELQERRAARVDINNISSSMKSLKIEDQRDQAMKKLEIFKKLDEDRFPIYQRLVFNNQTNVDRQHILIDYIELNEIMPERPELTVIFETSEVFILFGLATLYSCACPIVPLIVMIHNIVDINSSLFVNYTTTRRPQAQVATNIDPWLTIAEFMAITAVLSNSLLLYFSTPTLHIWVEKRWGDNFQEVYLLWILVGVEHAIIIIKEICAQMINDVPDWVDKSQQRVKREEEQMEDQDQANQLRDTVGAVAKIMDEQQEKRKKLYGDMKTMVDKQEAMFKEKNEKLQNTEKDLQECKKKLEESKKAQQLAERALKRMEEKEELHRASLADFLGIKGNEWFARDRTIELEKVLNKNLHKRLMHQTYHNLQKEVYSRRLNKLYDTKLTLSQADMILSGGFQINCSNCLSKLATIECLDCQDHYCKKCSTEIHLYEDVLQGHQILNLMEVPEIAGTSKWKKFEQYNFPVMQSNDSYSYLQLYFELLQKFFIELNSIEAIDKINLQGLFIDRHYEILLDMQAKILQGRDVKIFGDFTNNEVREKRRLDIEKVKSRFNDEELYYLNKIAFFLFSFKSNKLTFAEFAKTLSILQSGPLIQRCTLWLRMLCEEVRSTPDRFCSIPMTSKATDPDDFISRNQLEEAFAFSFAQRKSQNQQVAQHIAQPMSYKDIVDLIFESAAIQNEVKRDENKSSLEMERQWVTVGQIVDSINKDKNIQDFMTCIVQYKPSKIINKPTDIANLFPLSQNYMQQSTKDVQL